MRKLILVVFIVTCSLGLKAQSGYTPITDAKALEKIKVQFGEAAKKTSSIKSDFVQEKNLSMLSEKITSKGKFWFKKENMLRMEFSKPYEYLMILNKDNMYIKDGKKESRVSLKSNKIFQQINKIIMNCVEGTVFNNHDFTASPFQSESTYKIQLSPAGKELKEFFDSIDVIIDRKDYSVTTIIMNEKSGDNTTLHFMNRELNTTLPDALFDI